MNLSGRYVFPTGKQTLWELLNDPDVLARCTPGCESLTQAAEDEYAATLKVGVAAIKGTYQGKIALTDKDPPHAYTLQVEGNSPTGFVKGRARFQLSEEGDGQTVLAYEGDAQVGGLIAGVGQRVLEGVAKFLIGQFFKTLQKEVQERTRA